MNTESKNDKSPPSEHVEPTQSGSTKPLLTQSRDKKNTRSSSSSEEGFISNFIGRIYSKVSDTKAGKQLKEKVKEEVKEEVKNSIEQPEVKGALQLMTRLNSVWDYFESNKLAQVGVSCGLGGIAAGSLVYVKTDDVGDSVVVGLMSAAIGGLAFKFSEAVFFDKSEPIHEEYPPQITTGVTISSPNATKFINALTGASGVVLSGALSYKIYKIFVDAKEEEREAGEVSTLKIICDILLGVASILGLAGVLLDPKMLEAVSRASFAIMKSLDSLTKIPDLISKLVDRSETDNKVSEAVKQKNSNSKVDNLSNEFIESPEGKAYRRVREGEFDDFLDILRAGVTLFNETGFNDTETVYVGLEMIPMVQQDEDHPGKLKIEPSLERSMRKAYLEGKWECNCVDFVGSNGIKKICVRWKIVQEELESSVTEESETDSASGVIQTIWDNLKTTIKQFIETDLLLEHVLELAAIVSGIALIGGVIWEVYFKSENGNDKTDPKKKNIKDKKPKSKPKREASTKEAHGKQVHGRSGRSIRRAENREQKRMETNREEYLQLQSQKEDLREKLYELREYSRVSYNDPRAKEVRDRLLAIEKQLKEFYPGNEAKTKKKQSSSSSSSDSSSSDSSSEEDIGTIESIKNFFQEKFESLEARIVTPTPAHIKPHMNEQVKHCKTCKKEFTGKYHWCIDCREKHRKTSQHEAKPAQSKKCKCGVDIKQSEETCKKCSPKQSKKCVCGAPIKQKYDRCSSCHKNDVKIPEVKKKSDKSKMKPGPNANAQNQAKSKYEMDFAHSVLHECLVPIFNPCSDHPKEYFGCMLKIKKDNNVFFCINKHQLKADTYININQKNIVISSDKWRLFKDHGADSLYILPCTELQIPGVKSVSVAAFGPSSRVATFYGKHPEMQKDFIVSTDCELVSDGYVAHSATTLNNVCGGFLYDSSIQAAVGIHVKTNGPNPKGLNNFCVPFF